MKVEVRPGDGLEDNQEYEYTINAINSIGMTTTDLMNMSMNMLMLLFITVDISDVQRYSCCGFYY